MFALFEKALQPTTLPEQPTPPGGLIAFYWHFARQAKGLFAALFVTGFIVALLDFDRSRSFIGRVVTLVTAAAPEHLFADNLATPRSAWRWSLLVAAAAGASSRRTSSPTRRSPPMSPT